MTAPRLASDSNSGNVRVVARIRPLAKYELENGAKETVSSLNALDDDQDDLSGPELVQALPLSGDKRWFELDAVFDKSSTQEEVYERCGAKEAVCESIFSGFNCTILAYGQTGAGKTYSMGSAASSRTDDSAPQSTTIDENAGMIPRAVQDLFQQIEDKCDGNAEVELSYLEIYNEALRDLLSSSNDENLRIREHMNGEVYVSGLTSRRVTSPQEIGALMEEASSRRIVASTAMNAVSSRSHAMCVLRVKGLIETEDGATDKFTSKLTLVDLAGSERIKKTGAEGNRQKEGININKSLLVLGQVVAALAEQNKKRARKPPYRDSKLTRLLQDSLGGNSRTIMVACVSPADCNIEESINTLRYATSARNIKNTATRNIVQNITPEEAAKLQRENQLLKKQVEDLKRSLQLLSGSPNSPSSLSLTNTGSFDDSNDVFVEDKKMEDQIEADPESTKRVKDLESEVKSLKRELHDVRRSVGSSAVELPALKMEAEKLREEVKEVEQLKNENFELQENLNEATADAAASKKAAAKLSKIMDKLQELKGDELEKKRMEYDHIKKEEKWVKFLSHMLETRKEEMCKLVDDFELVVRVVESPVAMAAPMGAPSRTKSAEELPARRLRWLPRADPRPQIPEDEDLRRQLLTQHVSFFNSVRKTRLVFSLILVLVSSNLTFSSLSNTSKWKRSSHASLLRAIR